LDPAGLRAALISENRRVADFGQENVQWIGAAAFQILSLQVAPQFTRFDPHNGVENRIEWHGLPGHALQLNPDLLAADPVMRWEVGWSFRRAAGLSESG